MVTHDPVPGSGRRTRQQALTLLHEHTSSESLRRHALAVARAMEAYADKYGEDRDVWGITGILHDFDYERFPEFPSHPFKGNEILAEYGYPEDIRKAILGHVPETQVARDTLMARALYACDELCGFVMACAAVRPNGLADLTSSSVRKKMKDKAFARGVHREQIVAGAAELEVPLEEHIDFVIAALRPISAELGV